MKSFFAVIVALGMLLSAPACFADKVGGQGMGSVSRVALTGSPVFRTVSPQEARALMAQRKDLLVIDVRGADELKEGFIVGSQLVPFWEIAKGQTTLPSGRPLLLICAVGGRSYAVGQYLYRKGYPEVYNLQGGIDNWKRAGLPLQYP